MSICFLFPGQGSQFDGMAAELVQKNAIAREKFEYAQEFLHIDLSRYTSLSSAAYTSTNPTIYASTKKTSHTSATHALQTVTPSNDITTHASHVTTANSEHIIMQSTVFSKHASHVKDFNNIMNIQQQNAYINALSSQVAIYVMSCALYDIAMKDMYKEDMKDTCKHTCSINMIAGHSLGEYAAMYAANVFSFEMGLDILQKRALYIYELALPESDMMVCLFAVHVTHAQDLANQLCEDVALHFAGEFICEVANYNSSHQIVLSGHKFALEYVASIANIYDIIRTLFLKTTYPYHSSLLKSAGEKLALYLANKHFSQPILPIIWNSTHSSQLPMDISSDKQLINNMCRQIYSPVHWSKTIDYMLNQNITIFYECGPGKVLSNLLKYHDQYKRISVKALHI